MVGGVDGAGRGHKQQGQASVWGSQCLRSEAPLSVAASFCSKKGGRQLQAGEKAPGYRNVALG